MNKFLTILFLFVYVTLSVGLNIIVHTCGGESEALLVTTTVKDPCSCGDQAPMENNCCSTELKSVKLDDLQKSSVNPIGEKLIAVDLLFEDTHSLNTFPVSGFRFKTLIPFSPPPDKDLNITNSVFLI